MTVATAAAMTEKQLLELLRRRHARNGNGGSGEYAFLTHVRNDAAFNATRTFDALAMSLWPSRGLTLHAFEIKVSRGDWLRELKEPAKAEAAAKVCDRFSMVVANESIIAEGELPATWGLLAVRGGRLVCVKDAPLLPNADPKRPISRGFLVALLRAHGAVPLVELRELEAARQEAREQERDLSQRLIDSANKTAADLRDRISAFEAASGLTLTYWSGTQDPAAVGRAVKAVLEGDARADHARKALARARDDLQRAADHVNRLLEET